jgi:hypothetical protein
MMMMKIIIMSMWWYYVSELWPPIGLLFISQVIWEWRATVEWYWLLIRSPEPSSSPTNSHLIASRKNGWREWWIWPCKVFLFVLESDSFTYHKILWHGAPGFTSPLKVGMMWIFIALKNPSPQPDVNLQTLGLMASVLYITPPKWLR